jgi:hypothetical protein
MAGNIILRTLAVVITMGHLRQEGYVGWKSESKEGCCHSYLLKTMKEPDKRHGAQCPATYINEEMR